MVLTLLLAKGLATAAVAQPVAATEHTYGWVSPFVVMNVAEGRRTERILEALERVPDCVQERLSLIGSHLIVMGPRAPKDHHLRRQVNRDFLASGWRVLGAPFVRVQGRTYPLEQIAFVRRGASGPIGRSTLFTHWIPLTGRGEETALHEYGHLVAFALAVASTTEFYVLWAANSPPPVTDALSLRSEAVKQQEWFAREYERFYRSEASRAALSADVRSYFETLELRIHGGEYDGRFLELARLSSRNRYLKAVRESSRRLLRAETVRELNAVGAWGLGFYGQVWYTLQSATARREKGAAIDTLARQRRELVETGVIADESQMHLRETCGDLSDSALCRAVRRHRSRLETWHPCLGSPVEGCLISYGPSDHLLASDPDPVVAEFPWMSADRHRELALGRVRLRAAPISVQ